MARTLTLDDVVQKTSESDEVPLSLEPITKLEDDALFSWLTKQGFNKEKLNTLLASKKFINSAGLKLLIRIFRLVRERISIEDMHALLDAVDDKVLVKKILSAHDAHKEIRALIDSTAPLFPEPSVYDIDTKFPAESTIQHLLSLKETLGTDIIADAFVQCCPLSPEKWERFCSIEKIMELKLFERNPLDRIPLLFSAVSNHDTLAVRDMLASAIKEDCISEVLNTRDLDGESPLLRALLWQNIDAVQAILTAAKSAGCISEVLNFQHTSNYTPITLAFEQGKIWELLTTAKNAGCLRELLNNRGLEEESPLIQAIAHQNFDAVQAILTAAKSAGCISEVLNFQHTSNYTPITLAFEQGKFRELLITAENAGCLRELLNNRGLEEESPLLYAMAQQDVDAVRVDAVRAILTAAKSAGCVSEVLNFQHTSKNTPITFTLAQGNIQELLTTAENAGCLRELLNSKDKGGNNLLNLAIRLNIGNKTQAVVAILSAAQKADCVSEVLNAIDLDGESPLLQALLQQNIDAVQAILTAAKSAGCVSEVLNFQNKFNNTPITVAIKQGKIQELLTTAANAGCLRELLNHRDLDGESLLLQALLWQNFDAVRAILTAAKSAGCVSEVLNFQNKFNNTPITLAFARGNIQELLTIAEDTGCLRELLNHRDLDGGSPLLRAILRQNVDAVRAILAAAKRAGCISEVINLHDKSGNNPMSAAVYYKNKDIITVLLSHGASPNIYSKKGALLALAKSTQDSSLPELLIQHGADPEGDKKIQTILKYTHILGIKGNIPIVFEGKKDNDTLKEDSVLTAEGRTSNLALDHFSAVVGNIPDRFTNKSSLEAAVAECQRQRKNADIEGLIKKIKRDEAVYLNLGWTEHAVALWFFEGKIIVTNRGGGALPPPGTRIYSLDTNVDEDNIRELLNTCFIKEPSQEVFMTQLNKLVGSEKDRPDKFIGIILQKWQKVGNCSHANPKGSLAAIIAITEGTYLNEINKLRDSEQRNPLEDKESLYSWIEKEENQRKAEEIWAKSLEKTLYKEITSDMRQEAIEECIENIKQFPQESEGEKTILKCYLEQNIERARNPRKNAFMMKILDIGPSLGLSDEEIERYKQNITTSLESIDDKYTFPENSAAKKIIDQQRLLQPEHKALLFRKLEREKEKVDEVVEVNANTTTPHEPGKLPS